MLKELNVKVLNAYTSIKTTLDFSNLTFEQKIDVLRALAISVGNDKIIEDCK